ncbi:MAG: RHS repeat-associated core domain-containing protein, partial [Bacteroidota bacterium]
SKHYTIAAPGRLKEASSSIYGDLAWQYDVSGNLTHFQDTAYTYQFHQLKQGGTSAIPAAISAQYDASGNMKSLSLASENWQYSFDSRNRLLSASGPGTYQFAYDHHGRRIAKSDPDGTTVLYITPFYEVVVSGADSTSTRYFHGPTGRFGASTPGPDRSQSPEIYGSGTVYAHLDHLGSTQLTTDVDGQASRTVYSPYGQVRQRTSANNFRYGYGGKELDGTGLYYFAARYFHPELGRFVSADNQPGGKAGQADIFNPYAYVLNDPVSYADPSGHHFFKRVAHDVKHGSTTAWHKVKQGSAKGWQGAKHGSVNAWHDTKHAVMSRTGELVISSVINSL